MRRFIFWVISLFLAAFVGGALVGACLFYYYGAGLPDYKTLAVYEPPVVTRLYSNDGRVFAEYAYEKRIYVPNEAIPLHVKNAFLAAEDKNFYHHFGLDIPSILSAILTNLTRLGSSKRPVGASTITQQVAKNFLLADISHMVSLERKIKEAILSFRIEKAYDKDYILELYLNDVYLGNRSYGVAAAALNYFNKSLEELTIAEAAFLAALPKAPSRYDPVRHPEITYSRRNWVIGRMLEDGVITADEAKKAREEPISLQTRNLSSVVEGSYFAEEVRRELMQAFGEKSLYQNGYVVRTTLDPFLQAIAEETLQEGLLEYDRKHGWRGAILNLGLPNESYNQQGLGSVWQKKLKEIIKPAGSQQWELAVVLSLESDHVLIGFSDDTLGAIPLEELKWARRWISDDVRGLEVTHPKQVLRLGDVVLTEPVFIEKKEHASSGEGIEGKAEIYKRSKKHFFSKGKKAYKLCQIPAVSGALVVLEPHTGRVLAMQGGYSFSMSQFNRVTQAERQTGSAFKTFVYVAGLEAGLTPSTILDDSPFAVDLGYGLGVWRPNNWDKEFEGPITVRRSFEASRNVAAIRMVHEQVGMKRVAEVAKRLNIDSKLSPHQLAGVLGASETTLLRLTTAYAMLANGGRFVNPSFFDRVQDRWGKTVLVKNYKAYDASALKQEDLVPSLNDLRPQVIDPIVAYQMTSLLRGVVERGTGRLLKDLPHLIAAKSGTTNDFKDAWMVGYSPDFVLGIYVGFDTPRTLGDKGFGGLVAGPIFKKFMQRALANKPVIPFVVPKGVKLVRVNPYTGGKAPANFKEAIYEAFRPGTEVIQGDNTSECSTPNLSPEADCPLEPSVLGNEKAKDQRIKGLY